MIADGCELLVNVQPSMVAHKKEHSRWERELGISVAEQMLVWKHRRKRFQTVY
jgi:hypothetical protein